MLRHADIYSDGSYHAPQHIASWAFSLASAGERREGSGVLWAEGILAAEITAALEGIAAARRLGATSIAIISDSSEALAYLAGQRDRQRLPTIVQDRLTSADLTSITLRTVWVRSHQRHTSSGNARADALAKSALAAALRRG